MKAEFVVGIILMVLSCFSSAAGLLLLKSSAELEGDLPIWKRYRWMAGFSGVAVVATVLNLGAYDCLPMAVIAPFAGLTIVLTLLFASSGLLIDPETLSGREIVAACIILVGVGLASACGPRETPAAATLDVSTEVAYLGSRFRDPWVILVLCFFITLPLSFGLACRGQRLGKAQPVDLFGAVHIDRALMSTALSALGAAVTGAVSNTSLKITVQYVHLTVVALSNGTSISAIALTPGPWLSAILLLTCGPVQFMLLTATLGSGAVAFAVPLYQTALILATIFFGGMYFEEFGNRPPLVVLGFATGVVACLVGLVLMASAAGKAVAPVPAVEQVATRRRSITRPVGPDAPIATPDKGDADALPVLRDPRLRTGPISAGFVPYVDVETITDALAPGHETSTTESSQLIGSMSTHSQQQIGQAQKSGISTPKMRDRSMSSLA